MVRTGLQSSDLDIFAERASADVPNDLDKTFELDCTIVNAKREACLDICSMPKANATGNGLQIGESDVRT